MLKVAHISDLHFGAEDERALAFARDYINSSDFDLLLVSGDMTQSGRKLEFEQSAQWLKTLKAPKLLTIGNHDFPVFNLLERLRKPYRRYHELVMSDPSLHVHQFLCDLAQFTALRTAHPLQWRFDWSLGAVRNCDLSVSLEAVSQSQRPWNIVMVHHPLRNQLLAEVTGEVRKGVEAAKRLKTAGADLVLSGHIHEPFFFKGDNAFPAASGTGTMSTRLRAAKPSFNQLMIDEKAIKIETVTQSQGTTLLGCLTKT